MQSQKSDRELQWDILSLLQWTTDYFHTHRIESPRLDAEILLAHSLGIRRIDLYLRHDQPLIAPELARFKSFIRRRVRREPVAYIIGSKAFWSVTLRITRDVLIPRPETECLVEAALAVMQGRCGMRVFEIGTGSGAISLALAAERPDHRYDASDLSVKALWIARENARLNRAGGAVNFFCGDGFFPLREQRRPFDLIVSNPPYIRTGDIEGLQPEVACYEPRLALDGGPDGLRSIRHIIVHAAGYLKPGGYVILEIGHDQRRGVERIIRNSGLYDAVCFGKDYGGFDRIVSMKRKGAQGKPV